MPDPESGTGSGQFRRREPAVAGSHRFETWNALTLTETSVAEFVPAPKSLPTFRSGSPPTGLSATRKLAPNGVRGDDGAASFKRLPDNTGPTSALAERSRRIEGHRPHSGSAVSRANFRIPSRPAGSDMLTRPAGPFMHRKLTHADGGILLPHVYRVSFVFEAVIIDEFAVENQGLCDLHGPGRGVSFGIVDRNLDFEVPVVRPPDPLDHFALLREWISAGIQPEIVAETGGLHHQRVTIPFTGRVAVPGRSGILGERPSVGEDLAVLHVALGQDEHAAGYRENSFVVIVGPDSRSVARHAMNVRVQTLLDTALLDQSRGPRLVRQRILQRGGDIDELPGDLRV